MEKRQEPSPILTKVWAHNLRSLEDMELGLCPLTVLVGPNASGKSNIVDVLRFVADALRSGVDAAVTARHGIVAMRRWSLRGRPFDIEVGLEATVHGANVRYGFVLGGKPGGQYDIKREYAIVVSPDVEGGEWEFDVRKGDLVKPPLEGTKARQLELFEPARARSFEPTDLALPLPQIRRLFPLRPRRKNALGARPLSNPLTSLLLFIRQMRFYHIFPNVIREPQRPGSPYPLGEHGENLASVLRDMIKEDGHFFPDLRDALAKVVPGVCDVQVTQVGGYLVVKLKHTVEGGNGKGAWFDLSQESDGTLRLLGLLVALFQDPVPSLIAIEEPELTIHPGALAVLADLLQEATQRTQILITTHSPELIDHLPVESLRAVEAVWGVTKAGEVADHQREAVRRGLFSAGELHRMEGLERAKAAE